MKNVVIVIVVTAITFILFPRAARAQETVRTITIVPPTVQQTLDPGGKAEGVMKVINDSAESLTFTVSLSDFVVTDTKGTPNLLPPNTLAKKFSAGSWIGVSPQSFTVPPHEKQILNYFIQVPQDARPGGHYAAAVYTPTAVPGLKGSGAAVETKLGTLFYISVKGPISEYSLVEKFLANFFSEYGPATIQTTIKNFGDLHIQPSGQIKVTDLLGRTITNASLAKFNIFPGAGRDYQNAVGSKIMLGRFKAELLASYGVNKNLPLMATVYFWVFPWKLASIAILIIVAAVLGWVYWKQRKKIKN